MEKKRSRWRDDDKDAEMLERRRLEKEKKKKAKLAKKSTTSTAAGEVLGTVAATPVPAVNATQDRSTVLATDGDTTVSIDDGIVNGENDAQLTVNNLLLYPSRPIHSCRSVEDYEHMGHIAEGSYGVVFRGRDLQTDNVYALKKIKSDKDQEGFPITSLREIQTLFAIRHENVVAIREVVVGSSMDHIYIVMEHVDHELSSILRSSTPTSPPFLHAEVKTLLRQLLSATACMHANGIIHRDLKTSNLLLSNSGQIKVGDFGLARFLPCVPAPSSSQDSKNNGRMTPLVVTLWYRAPELLLGDRTYSTEIDIWSIGCIFAELLTTRPLFEGRSEINQIQRIFEYLGYPTEKTWPGYSKLPHGRTIRQPSSAKPPQPLHSHFPFLTASGVDLLSKLLSLDPSQRISAADALMHPYFTDAPLPAAPSTFPKFPSTVVGSPSGNQTPTAPVAHHPARRRGTAAATSEGGDTKVTGDEFGSDDALDTFEGNGQQGLFVPEQRGGAGFHLRLG
ncbi:kinase-like domain-containing protein [Limtongia smithiae]|uniref:kinase-like domain-containing protein n=1 Tax=Limtongia smithiae TaxID=1125753 RepID=UPI0034CFF30B